MRCILLIIFFISVNAFSQDKTIYLNEKGYQVSEANQAYYRIIKDYNLDKDLYATSTYYKSGKLQMEGFSKSKDQLVEEGEFRYYYENGQKRLVENFKNGKPEGNYASWRENGNKETEGEYLPDKNGGESQFKILQFWDESNTQKVIDGNGILEEISKDETVKGRIKDGLKDGVWAGVCKSDSLIFNDTYEKGKFVSGSSSDLDYSKYTYTTVQVKPFLENGIDEFRNYIGKNYRVPRGAEQGGKIFVSFIIEKDGSIVEAKIVKGIGETADNEALRVVKNFPGKWIPGTYRGKPVRTTFMMPINVAPKK